MTQSSLNSRDCYRVKTDTSEYLELKCNVGKKHSQLVITVWLAKKEY